MAGWRQDITYAIRQFLRTPGTAAVIILTIGIGVGANTALFAPQTMDSIIAVTLAVPSILILVSLLASYLPARRAMKVDPMAALRYQ